MFDTRQFFAAILIGLISITSALAQKGEGVTLDKEVVYGKAGDEKLTLHLARPEKQDKPAPCILVIHGGAWRAGSKDGHIPQIQEFAKRGYVAASIGYRFCPKHPFPAQVEDVKCAVRYLRANAEKYGIDKQRFGAVGFSAGAHLSMMLGVMGKEDGLEGDGGSPDESSQVQAVVAYFGPTDLLADDIPERSEKLVDDFVGSKRSDNPDARKKASPITYVSKGDAALLIFQGTKDELVPHTQAFRIVDKLTESGVPGRVEILLGAGHGWGGKELEHTVRETMLFFDERLRASQR